MNQETILSCSGSNSEEFMNPDLWPGLWMVLESQQGDSGVLTTHSLAEAEVLPVTSSMASLKAD